MIGANDNRDPDSFDEGEMTFSGGVAGLAMIVLFVALLGGILVLAHSLARPTP